MELGPVPVTPHCYGQSVPVTSNPRRCRVVLQIVGFRAYVVRLDLAEASTIWKTIGIGESEETRMG